MEKTSVFNLIIIDESGSMGPARQGAIDGCNETINVVKSAQEAHKDSQRHFISIYAFQTNDAHPSHYIYKNVSPENVKPISNEDYQPWGATPLLDAIGMTIADLKAVAATHEDAVGIVTIITDGYENSSKEYSWSQVRELISEVKELGWQVNFIGANIDVKDVSSKLNIDACMSFQNTEEGTRDMFHSTSASMCMAYDNMSEEKDLPIADKIKARKKRFSSFFD